MGSEWCFCFFEALLLTWLANLVINWSLFAACFSWHGLWGFASIVLSMQAFSLGSKATIVWIPCLPCDLGVALHLYFHIFAKCCSLLVFPVVFSFCLFFRFLFRALVLALAFAWTNRSYKIIAHDMHLDFVQNLFYPFKNWSWLKRNWILTWTLHDLNLHKLVVSVYIAANWLV